MQTQIGKYQIIREVGRGGMGIVYEARHPHLDRRVALKVLPRQLTFNRQFVERFLREGQLAAALTHPNVVSVYEAGEADGLYFIAMEFVEGTDLAHMLHNQGVLEFNLALEVLGQVAAGLDAAHAAGIIHRDIKPENILLDVKGVAKVADFGIARALEASGGTQSGTVIGTAEYMAPEQILGRPIDSRSDVYSLACVAYEMLAGTPPFGRISGERTGMSLMHDHAYSEPPPLRFPQSFGLEGAAAAIRSALSKDAGARPPSAGALVELLRRNEVASPSRRRAIGGALVSAAGLLGGAYAIQIWNRPNRPGAITAIPSSRSAVPAPQPPKPWYLQRKGNWFLSEKRNELGRPFLSGAREVQFNSKRGLFAVTTEDAIFTLDITNWIPTPVDWNDTGSSVGRCCWLDSDHLIYERNRMGQAVDFGKARFDGNSRTSLSVGSPGNRLPDSYSLPTVSAPHHFLAGIAAYNGTETTFWLAVQDLGEERSRWEVLPTMHTDSYEQLTPTGLAIAPDGKSLVVALTDTRSSYGGEPIAELIEYGVDTLSVRHRYRLQLEEAVEAVVPHWQDGGQLLCETVVGARDFKTENGRTYLLDRARGVLKRYAERYTTTIYARNLALPDYPITPLAPRTQSQSAGGES